MGTGFAPHSVASFRERIIGRVRSPQPGAMLVVVGGIHGNEPAGVGALQGIIRRLQDEKLLARGDVLAIRGNLSALEARRRFVDEDLNRRWTARQLERLRGGTALRAIEDAEQLALFEVLQAGFTEARGPIALLDLHTTSGEGGTFVVFADTLRSRNFARRFPVPAVLGLEEKLEGTLVDYVGLLGHVAVGFEGGQHSDPRSVERLGAAVWLVLAELGLVDPARCSWLPGERRLLKEATQGLPRVVEVTYRHGVKKGDGFHMIPGFRSFDPVRRGDVVARDARGEVEIPEDGFLLMPLYQEQGDDGFFVARRVWAVWLALSALLRHLRAGRLAHWLPGIERTPGQPHALTVDRGVARWYSLEVLHLLGFRKRSEEGDRMVVERRQHDLP